MPNIFGKLTFHGGVHPPHNKKQTQSLPIEIFPAPAKVIIPLNQHQGVPARILIKRGDEVKIGQVLAEAGEFASSSVHASVSGTVTAVADFPNASGKDSPAAEIDNNGKDDSIDFAGAGDKWRELVRDEIIQKIAAAGIVGMGGDAFPTQVKLSPPSSRRIDTLIINGAESEPYLTADHRIMLEKTNEFLLGAVILKKVLNAETVHIGIEDNKPDAIAKVLDALKSPEYDKISVAKLRAKYPQGEEKQLINSITRRQVPSGGFPLDVGCVVLNAGTAYAVWNAIIHGKPLYERILTVSGPAIGKPANLLVRIGTPAIDILKHCQVDLEKTQKVIMGGPMTGLALSDINVPVIKATSGLLAITHTLPAEKAHDCIRCGNCVKACPARLVPLHIAKLVAKRFYAEAERNNVSDCFECGSCAYVCPSKVNLVHYMKLGKYHVSAAGKAEAKTA